MVSVFSFVQPVPAFSVFMDFVFDKRISLFYHLVNEKKRFRSYPFVLDLLNNPEDKLTSAKKRTNFREAQLVVGNRILQ